MSVITKEVVFSPLSVGWCAGIMQKRLDGLQRNLNGRMGNRQRKIPLHFGAKSDKEGDPGIFILEIIRKWETQFGIDLSYLPAAERKVQGT